MPYVRTVKTASGATAVQIVYSSHRGSRDIEHIGSAHDDVELELLKAVARQRLAAGQGVLELVSRSGELWSVRVIPAVDVAVVQVNAACRCGCTVAAA